MLQQETHNGILSILICYMPIDNMNMIHISDGVVDTCTDAQSVINTVNHDDLVLVVSHPLIDFKMNLYFVNPFQ